MAPIVVDSRGFFVYSIAMKECIFCKKTETPQWYAGPSCKSCYRKQDRIKNREKYDARDRANYQKTKEKRLEQAKKYYQKNSEHIKARTKAHRQKVGDQRRLGYMAEWNDKNKEKMFKYFSNYRNENREKVRKAWRDWNRRNKEYRAFMTAKRRAKKLKATPSWLTKEQLHEIKEIYKNCPSGYDVDHIVPLQGETVSGLHVPWNLQYLLSAENRSKSNNL